MLNKLRNEQGFTLIELLIVVAIIGILAAIAIPQFAAYRQRGFNSSAQSDMKNGKTSQEALFADFQTYGKTQGSGPTVATMVLLGAATNTTGAGAFSSGPAPASTATVAGIMLSGPNNVGSGVGVGLAVSNGVVFQSSTLAPIAPALTTASYNMTSKHTQGPRIFYSEPENTAIMYVSNDAWVGESLATPPTGYVAPANLTTNQDIVPGTTGGGGAPVAAWAAL